MKEKDVELPDVQEFLKLSRTLIRQIKFFKKTKISKEYLELIEKAAVNVRDHLNEYIEKTQET